MNILLHCSSKLYKLTLCGSDSLWSQTFDLKELISTPAPCASKRTKWFLYYHITHRADAVSKQWLVTWSLVSKQTIRIIQYVPFYFLFTTIFLLEYRTTYTTFKASILSWCSCTICSEAITEITLKSTFFLGWLRKGQLILATTTASSASAPLGWINKLKQQYVTSILRMGGKKL